MLYPVKVIATSLILLILITTSHLSMGDAQENVSATPLTKTLYFIQGNGGNIGASIGEDGTFLIDNQFAKMTPEILDTLKKAGGDVPKFVINTHWHGDHTGGNVNLDQQGSIIVAHDNVRKRLSEDNFIEAFNMTSAALTKTGLPVITFGNAISFYLNGDTIEIIHLAKAHTDGDSIVHFKPSNVIHTGDLFFNGFYPFIDIAHGGSLKGMINGVSKILAIADNNTVIIPGHGPVANKADLQRYHTMLQQAYQQLTQLKQANKTLEQAIAAKPLAALEQDWGNGIFTSDKWIAVIYDGLD